MAELTVHFVGICTHVTTEVLTLPDDRPMHRVVLVHAPAGTIDGRAVGGHEPVIKAMHTIEPTSLRARVANAIGDLTYDHSYGEVMPSLTTLTAEAGTIGLDADVVFTGRSAAMHFDIDRGHLSAQRDCETGAIYATLKVETEGDPRIEFVPMIDGFECPSPLVLRDGEEITVANQDIDTTLEEVFDFLFHYTILQTLPTNPRIPDFAMPSLTRPLGRIQIHRVEITGPGCSNSNWP